MEKKKKLLILVSIMLTVLVVLLCVILVPFKHEASKEDYEQVVPVENPEDYDPESGIKLIPEGNGVTYAEEQDGAEIQFKKEDTSTFVGEWVATSDMAMQLYGNVDITINDDHTWSGNITDEDFSGKWVESGDGIEIKVGVHDIGLAFDSNDNLIMTRPVPDGEDIYTVLTRKTSDEE